MLTYKGKEDFTQYMPWNTTLYIVVSDMRHQIYMSIMIYNSLK